MKWLHAVTAVIALLAGPASAQFTLEGGPSDWRQVFGEFAIEDLGVGEIGAVWSISYCHADGKVFIPAHNLLSESRSDYGITFRIRRLPGDQVEITSVVGSQASTDAVADIGRSLSTAAACSLYESRGAPLFEVVSIDGATSPQELVAQ